MSVTNPLEKLRHATKRNVVGCFMVALCNRETIYIFMPWFVFSFFFSSPNLSRRRLDVYNTSTYGVALVQISNVGVKRAARDSLQIQDKK